MILYKNYEYLQNIPEVSNVVNKALENYLGYDFEKLFEDINQHINNISVLKTHVLLASKSDLQFIRDINIVKFKKITHISKQLYGNRITGHVVNRNVDKFIVNTFKQM